MVVECGDVCIRTRRECLVRQRRHLGHWTRSGTGPGSAFKRRLAWNGLRKIIQILPRNGTLSDCCMKKHTISAPLWLFTKKLYDNSYKIHLYCLSRRSYTKNHTNEAGFLRRIPKRRRIWALQPVIWSLNMNGSPALFSTVILPDDPLHQIIRTILHKYGNVERRHRQTADDRGYMAERPNELDILRLPNEHDLRMPLPLEPFDQHRVHVRHSLQQLLQWCGSLLHKRRARFGDDGRRRRRHGVGRFFHSYITLIGLVFAR